MYMYILLFPYEPVCVAGTVQVMCTLILQVGTWAGNLMLTHDHDDFPSDVFVTLAAVGTTLSICELSIASDYLWPQASISSDS